MEALVSGQPSFTKNPSRTPSVEGSVVSRVSHLKSLEYASMYKACISESIQEKERSIFLTECDTPQGRWSGPYIYAQTFEQADNQVLQIKDWLNNINLPHGDLRVIGVLREIIPASDTE